MNDNKDCQTQQEAIAALVLDEMAPQAADELKKHIDGCQTCTVLYQALATEEETIRSAFEAIADRSEAVQDSLVEQLGKELGKPPGRSARPVLRTVLQSRITKLAAAAAVIVAISMYCWLSPDGEPLTYIELISAAQAAERELFYGDGITHILNEIVVYPRSADDIVDEQEKSELQEKLDGLNSFLEYHWLPMCSVKADGRLRFNQLQLPASDTEAYTIVDESWYEPATGNFARVLKLDEQVFFANSYDGWFVYSSETGADGTTRLVKEQAADDFTPPQNPAEYLGITAGLPGNIQKESGPPILDIEEGRLADGTAVRIAKAGFTDVYGELTAYWLFRIRKHDSTIAEMEFVIGDQPQLLIRRVLSETVEAAGVSWSLSELPQEVGATQEAVKPSVSPDMVIPNVSVKHMVEKATFETYIFATNPPWAGHREIADCIDPPSPGHRMFVIAYRADDGRHVVTVQSHSYNTMLGTFAKMGEVVYTSPNGFKVWGGGPQKWYAEILLSSARSAIKDPPSDDRIGYVLESPAGTFPALAVNGPLTEEELHSLIDSLIPARKVLELSGTIE